MNLFDIVNRKDRALEILSGSAVSLTMKSLRGARRAVQLRPNTTIRMRDAHEFYPLLDRPTDLKWEIVSNRRLKSSRLTISLIDLQNRKRAVLSHVQTNFFKTKARAVLNWPSDLKADDRFHLELSSGRSGALIEIGAAFDSRAGILPKLNGRGVEVGPGLNPHVIPSEKIDPLYVETSTLDEWIALYVKEKRPISEKLNDLRDRYLIADAHKLEAFNDGSLDFIFSNHVVEHLCNPLDVFENWLSKLKSGGLLTGVIPDCRYTFDLRQQPSTKNMWLEEKRLGSFEPSMDHYLRWCKFTQPKNTPEDLIRRKYSIHVHYYTPDNFREMLQLLELNGKIRSISFSESQNNKDFGFILEKA